MARRPPKPSAPVSNSELSRDVYGFTVRPHHFQRYKEYAVIYKEEEAERSARWERFLTNYSQSVLPEEHGADSEGSRTEDDEPTGTARADGESKLETWGKIRPSLWPVERALFSRFKKKKKKTTVLENHESEEAAPPKTESSPQNCTALSGDESEEEFYDVERSDTVQDGSQSLAEAPINDTEQEEEACPWKDELDALVQGGVPMALRGELWQVFVGTRARRTKGHYQALLTLLADGGGDSDGVGGLYNGTSANYSLSDSGILEKWTSQIEKDLPRTFPGHPALDEDGRNALRRLLTAYARHNPDVGYCQAMNFFAALLLLMMPEENAFWTLAGFIDDYFEGYYSERMLESQVDQLVLEDLVRKHFPRLVSHLDTLGVQVAWVTGPWFLSVFVNILPWESVLRVWDVLLYEGNRSMLFRIALALLEQYGPKIMAAKDAGDAVTMLQSLAGSTFDSSQLVLVACMGYQSVDDSLLQELGSQKRPQVLAALSERSTMERSGWRSVSRTVSSKVYNHDMPSNQLAERNIEKILGQTLPNGEASLKDDVDGSYKNLSHIDVLDEEEACVTDLIEQVKWLKVELSRALEESRAANLRADELETAFMELVKEDNRRLLSAKVETLEDELRHLKQVVSDKEKQEEAMVKVMLQMEQEQRLAEDARQYAEQEASVQRNAASILQAKYESAIKSLAEMEKRAVMAESMLEATIQYQALGNGQVVSSKTGNDCAAAQEEASRWSWPRLSAKPVEPSPASTGVSADGEFAKELVRSKSPDAQLAGSPQKPSLLSRRFSLGWRDKSKGKNDIPDVPLVSSPSAQSPTVQSDFSSTSLSPQSSLDQLSAVSQDDTNTSTSKDTNGPI